MSLEPYAIGVCSWSLKVTSIPELRRCLDRLGTSVIQIACGDPVHASWEEGDRMPEAARAAGLVMTAAMLGFPGEDYTSPETIRRTGGFGDPALRPRRLEVLEWGLERTSALGLDYLMLHAGFLPEPGEPDRGPFLDTLGRAAAMAHSRRITLGFETGQETAELLRRTLDDLQCANVKINFDPANMLLYDMGDPLRAVEILGADIASVHCKDANRPTTPGEWGEEVPLGQGQVNIAAFVRTLQKVGYRGPLVIEREAGTQEERARDCEHGIRVLRECLRG